jgi:hypothetical protein
MTAATPTSSGEMSRKGVAWLSSHKSLEEIAIPRDLRPDLLMY